LSHFLKVFFFAPFFSPQDPTFLSSRAIFFWSFISTLSNNPSSETDTTFHYCWRVKGSFKLVWMEIYLPMQFTDWLLVEVALLLIGLTQIYLSKTGFNSLGRDRKALVLYGILPSSPT
jgi:hypothetical protein